MKPRETAHIVASAENTGHQSQRTEAGEINDGAATLNNSYLRRKQPAKKESQEEKTENTEGKVVQKMQNLQDTRTYPETLATKNSLYPEQKPAEGQHQRDHAEAEAGSLWQKSWQLNDAAGWRTEKTILWGWRQHGCSNLA